MSFHAPDSDLARLHASAGEPVEIHPWTLDVLRAARQFEQESDGAFDVTVAALLVHWGLLPRPPGRAGRRAGGLRAALDILPDERVRLRRPVWIDLGGIAKGFAVDRAIETLRAAGVPAALVNAGGDLRAYGTRPWQVEIRDPRLARRANLGFELADGAVATSGTYFAESRFRGKQVSALVDPATGTALVGGRSVSILAPTCIEADALTKIALVTRASRLADLLARHGARRIAQYGPESVPAARGEAGAHGASR